MDVSAVYDLNSNIYHNCKGVQAHMGKITGQIIAS